MGNKTLKQKEVVNNLEKFYKSREEVIKCYLMQVTMQEKMKLREKSLKYQHPNKCFKDC